MAKFTRDDIFGKEKSQQSVVTVPIKSHLPIQKSLIKEPYRSMSENEDLIVRVMESAIGALTRRQICRLIGRKKSPGLNKLIEQLVSNGILCKYTTRRPNGVDMYLYEIQKWQ
jgi:hypothetical protein